MIRLVVVGAGGCGRETLDVIGAVNQQRDMHLDVVGVVDDGPRDQDLERLQRRGVRYLGTTHQWLSESDEAGYALGVGNPLARRAVDERWRVAGRHAVTLVHPHATVGSEATIGEGTVVCSGVQVSTNVVLGRHVHLNPNTTIGHDAVLGDYVSVNPGAIVSGACRIEHGVLLGAGAIVLQGLSVGAGSVVGAAACVVRDVDSERVVRGVPAK